MSTLYENSHIKLGFILKRFSYKEVHLYKRGSHTQRRSTYRGGPHTEEVHIQRRSTYRGGSHTEEAHIQRRSTYKGGPHTEEVLIQRRSTYRRGPHKEEVPIQSYTCTVHYIYLCAVTLICYHYR